ncbi:hypothetical protein LXL04_011920 [Taraxacum kok-saghyz]
MKPKREKEGRKSEVDDISTTRSHDERDRQFGNEKGKTSLQVYWCSVMLLPKTIIKDIEKVFKGFLWTGGDLKKGKAKVAWKMVCRPTEEGGLGIRDLQTWNEALLTRQIWRLFTVKDSLWVDWVKCHHLLKHSFWEVKKKDLQGFSWSNLLVLRDKIWKHVWIKPGDGLTTNMWFDNWHFSGPLFRIIPENERSIQGLTNNMSLHQFCNIFYLGWPGGWDVRFPTIQMQGLPNLQMHKNDQVLWKDISDKVTNFSPTQERNPTVLWNKIVWFKSQIPSHAIILWLALHNRLMTHDRMITWSTNTNLQCTLCKTNPDSIVHLFFECNYSCEVWNKVCLLCNIHITETNLHQIVELLRSRHTSNNTQTDIEKLTLAASVYYIWRENYTHMINLLKKYTILSEPGYVECNLSGIKLWKKYVEIGRFRGLEAGHKFKIMKMKFTEDEGGRCDFGDIIGWLMGFMIINIFLCNFRTYIANSGLSARMITSS